MDQASTPVSEFAGLSVSDQIEKMNSILIKATKDFTSDTEKELIQFLRDDFINTYQDSSVRYLWGSNEWEKKDFLEMLSTILDHYITNQHIETVCILLSTLALLSQNFNMLQWSAET